MLFASFFARRRRRDTAAHDLYVGAVEQARQPGLYLRYGIADTVDGRFDLLVAHAFLLMRRLGGIGGARAGDAKALSQALFDLMFADMDQNLREIGVSDMVIGKKVKQMARAFYGRVEAYDSAFQREGEALAEAVARNLYRGTPPSAEAAASFATYLRRQAGHLAGQGDDDLLAGRAGWLAEENAP
jgi:cytochrome b pre-mRNA-processing protein 3